MTKIILFLITLLITTTTFSQVGNYITSEEYQYRKLHNLLIGDEVVISGNIVDVSTLPNAQHYVVSVAQTKAAGCSPFIPPTTPAVTLPADADDFSLTGIAIPFSFCFFGTTETTVYMNSNGNISFGASNSSYTATAFPSNGPKLIAAFWADFDLNGVGAMHYTVTPTAMIFTWVDCGYFNNKIDKKNTCQIIITDLTDPLVPNGNVSIRYSDMQWTTGGANGGINGFGGTPATAGANRGNNVNYFQLGRFDHAGTDYDGPNGINDGVDYLDGKSFNFNFCTLNSGNIDPIPTNQICDTLGVCHSVGDTLDITFPFLSPENNQLTTVTFSSPTLTNILVVSNTVGTNGVLRLKIIGALETVGFHDLTITGTDNYSTPGVTAFTYKVEVTDISTAFPVLPLITYTPGCAPVEIGIHNANYDGFSWTNNSSTDSITTISSSYNGTLSVNVVNGGCILQIDTLLSIQSTPFFRLQGSLQYCPDNLTTSLFIPDSLALDSVHWALNATPTVVLSTDFSPKLSAGTYTARIWSIGSYCFKDTVFTITTQPNLVLTSDKVTCLPAISLTGNTGGIGTGSWSVLGSPSPSPTFSNQNLNPTVTFNSYGVFNLIYTENGCQDKDTIKITWEAPPILGINSDFFVCPGVKEKISISDSLNMQSMSWGITPPAANALFSTNIVAGTYNVQLVSLNGCVKDSTFTVTSQAPVVLTYPTNIVCWDSLEMTGNTGPGFIGQWSYIGPTSGSTATFRAIDSLNTGVKLSQNYGTWYLIFTEPVCNDDDTLTFISTPGAYVDVNDFELCLGNTITIESVILYPEFITSILWNTGATTPTIDISAGGTYTVTVTNACQSSTDNSIVDGHICDIEMPNVFSPNDDGINDLYFINGDKEIFKEFNISIVNRWGNKIKVYNDPYGTWDGTNSNGEKVPQGVYFYSVKAVTLQDEELTKKGFIHVIYENK
jgi:gliding motility-associated-like protein